MASRLTRPCPLVTERFGAMPDQPLAGHRDSSRPCDLRRRAVALLVHPLPDIVLGDFEGAGHVTHEIADQQAVVTMRARGLAWVDVTPSAPMSRFHVDLE